MAATIVNIYRDTPEYKIFDITIPEVDAVRLITNLTFAVGGMGNFTQTPQMWWNVEITPAGATPSVNASFAINNVTASGFRVEKTSVTFATAFVHTYRVYMTSRRFFQI